MPTVFRYLLLATTVLVGLASVLLPVAAQTETVLHNFHQLVTPNDGLISSAQLVEASDGNYYGTTTYGGAVGGGTLFRVTPTGTVTILHSFQDGTLANDGYAPASGLAIGSDGNLYGTAVGGGKAGQGVVFRLTVTGTVTILHSFGDGKVANDGAYPRAGLLLGTDKAFYGTTYLGGSAGYGTAFRMTSGGSLSIIHAFTSGKDGSYPSSALTVAKDGNLYGTTFTGGAGTGVGTVYEISAKGVESILHSFGAGQANDGASPFAGLIQATDGFLYGTTLDGGSAGFGTVFRVSTTGTETPIHSFSDGSVPNDGAYPEAAVIQGADGNLYGTTTYGTGTTGTVGSIFQMTLTGTETIIHDFGSVPNDGYNSQASLFQGTGSNFYGSTVEGGSASSGIIFAVAATGTYTILHSFGQLVTPGDGENPRGSLVLAPTGTAYSGTTLNGGVSDAGTVYDFTPLSLLTATLHSFLDGTVKNDGTSPDSGLLLGADGNFFGTTTSGGTEGLGTFYKISSVGKITILHNFGDGKIPSDGANPEAGLVLGANGNYYGTTTAGGAAAAGTLFMATPSGTITILHSFGDGKVPHDGLTPQSGVVLAFDGNIYGTTYSGGVNAGGTVFRINPTTNAYTLVYSFGATPSDGLNPNAELFLANDDGIYGTTQNGGTASDGTAYKFGRYGAYSVIHNFGAVAGDGAFPQARFTQLIDGNLAGATTGGGSAGHGTAFEMSLTGTVTVLHSFADGTVANDGTAPQGGLTENSLGTLYGTTYNGGATTPFTDSGTLYELVKPAQTVSFSALGNRYVNHGPFSIYATASSGLPVVFSVLSGPASVSGNKVTLSGQTGTVSIQAEQVGSPHFAPATATQSFAVTLVPQSIKFNSIPDQIYGTSITLTATASSGLAIGYTVTGPATLSGTTLTFTGVGKVTVIASQPGNDTYAPAPAVTRSFTVNPAKQTITFPTIPTQTYPSAPFTVSASASSSLAVTFSITSGPATVSGNNVTLTGSGTVVIAATQAGNADYLSATTSQSFTVTGQ